MRLGRLTLRLLHPLKFAVPAYVPACRFDMLERTVGYELEQPNVKWQMAFRTRPSVPGPHSCLRGILHV